MSDLTNALKSVVIARKATRQVMDDLLVKRDAAAKAFDAENKDLIEQATAAKETLALTEEACRRLILAEYERTKNKKPAEGAGVRVGTTMEYDPEKAFEWALDHKMALSLAARKFEQIAETWVPANAFKDSSEYVIPTFPFVTVKQNPTATISTDLSFLLEDETP